MNILKLTSLVLIGLLFTSSTSIAAKPTSLTDTIPDANLLNGIKMIKNGRLAAQERDSLKVAIGIYEERIRNYQKLIFNFETTVSKHNSKDSSRLAQIDFYKQEITIYKDFITEYRKALQDQKRRHIKQMLLMSILTVIAFII